MFIMTMNLSGTASEVAAYETDSLENATNSLKSPLDWTMPSALTGGGNATNCSNETIWQPEPTFSISGRIFNDLNGDGARRSDEWGLEGWDVLLAKPDGGSSAVKTNRKGDYFFSGLSTGVYRVVVAAEEKWTATAPAMGIQKMYLYDINESEIDFGFCFVEDATEYVTINATAINATIVTENDWQNPQ